LQWQLTKPLNPVRVEKELLRLGDLDRYVSIGWDLSAEKGTYVLVVKALRDPRAPPLLVSSVTIPSNDSAYRGTHLLPADQYVLGLPWKFDGYSVEERRGDNCAVLTIHTFARSDDCRTSLVGHSL
jgi:hypothetical protein